MNREEAIMILKMLLEGCVGLDCHTFELVPTNLSGTKPDRYQIIIRGPLEEETNKKIQKMLTKQQLYWQIGNIWKTRRSVKKLESDTLIIYKAKSPEMNKSTK